MNQLDSGIVLGRVLLAALLGGVMGAEREYRRKPAGLRTNTLIAMGAALFPAISQGLGASDRVAAQVVTGIGFLGTGAILRNRQNVHGLTTAATIWVNAAIGMAAGLGHYVVAVGSAMLALLVLLALPFIEDWFEKHNETSGEP